MVRAKVIDRDLGWRAMIKAVESLAGDSYAKVGVLADDSKGGALSRKPKRAYAQGVVLDESTDDILTVAELASVMEYGTEDGHIPARSFLRSTFDEKRDEIKETGAKCLGKILDGKMSLGTALNLMGLQLATDVKKKITIDGVPPPDAPSTIAAKGSDRTLVDSGRLLGAITWQVIFGKVAKAVSAR